MFQRPSIDMTENDEAGQYVEILTPGGIVRVSTGLVTTHDYPPRQAVVVEVERNVLGRAQTQTGGDWDVEVDEHLTGMRVDIRLTRK